ncbi:MAG: 4-hydroxy-3-methylbut-2-enyl diphosphate reductase [Chloroflexi bacterium]|nr:4-hydroxy-3-methylbut-2-enyl diphosphate reductase [Chloroflexota bacterium]MBI2979403.1 4-hydroxy-3-methylbut-2-enyl diphosphate reductase [Chloroflexota bacterium]
MALKIEKVAAIGFCYGVKRAIDILEKITHERSRVETLGPVVHNKQVMQRLAGIGISVASSIDNIKGNTVAIGTHGVIPQIEEELRTKCAEVINTTCPFVHRAQIAARRLARSGFWVIIYGDADHPEVKGILGWTGSKGIATLDDKFIATLEPLPRRLGILSQTTQIPARFNQFVKNIIDFALTKDSELRIIDTICHDIRERQQAALELANRVDLMLVIGSHTSANTNHLTELCATVCPTYLVETAGEIQPAWLKGHHHIGITSGASTAQETINEVLSRLESMAS